MRLSLLLFTLLAAAWAQDESVPSLRGTITDPSGAAVPSATVQLRGPGRERRVKTDHAGQYLFPALAQGKYQLRVTAKGFAVAQKNGLAIERPSVFDTGLVIGTSAQVIDVRDQLRSVSTEADANGSAIVMREQQIAALSDDPDELALQLQALAGPAPGPGGGQIFIDGFTGGNLPPKSAIREIRINANPFSPEYDRPGFARVEVFTKPGSDALHGQGFAQVGDDILNSRNPLLTQSTRPPYRSQLYGLSVGGPLWRNKASFSLDAEHRQIDENAYILATTPEGAINQALATPQSRSSVRPRLDYSLTPRNTLVVRYQYLKSGLDNLGAGDFNLPSRAYDERQSEHSVQVTETAMISARAINETRFQYLRAASADTAGSMAPAINVEGAFTGGGATVGNSGSVNNNWELTNISTYIKGRHTIKWGARVRQSRLADTSRTNFAGTFTFYTLADYEAGRPAQVSMNSGTPLANVAQADAGVFLNDDWRVRPNLTLSYGVRYEAQTNLGGAADWAPRLGIAWGLNKRTVLRAGAGAFYDRIPLSVTLNRERYDGIAQQSFFILNPTFFPEIPPVADLRSGGQPQQTRPVAGGVRSPRLYQGSVGVERQLTPTARVTVTWVSSRGVHLLNVRNLDQSLRLLTESAGLSRQNQVMAYANASYKKITLFGSYALSYGRDNNEGLPADPYNLRAEWGPSSYGDIRHRGVITATVPLWWRFGVSPFFVVNSGQPYNITTGLDPDHTGAATARPGLAAGPCRGKGCFNLNPAPGTAIAHNYGRGPGAVNLGMRVSRTWGFGPEKTTAPTGQGGGHGGAAAPGSGRRYSLTLSASSLNALNHPNFAPPNGDLSSPYFGQYRALGGMVVMSHGGGASAYNRKIDLQVRFAF